MVDKERLGPFAIKCSDQPLYVPVTGGTNLSHNIMKDHRWWFWMTCFQQKFKGKWLMSWLLYSREEACENAGRQPTSRQSRLSESVRSSTVPILCKYNSALRREKKGEEQRENRRLIEGTYSIVVLTVPTKVLQLVFTTHMYQYAVSYVGTYDYLVRR